ncbi:NUDIX hydrolase [Psychroflexus maritimus]|uniref:CoA pyrophosphatase n=1 Tax=Psychroflexus maritimus TaxID=2714865 RepID=A0A967E045_9FLAO|nr:CoA pyrophosphatase [Psychroflexus maritimus]NGZ90888.1 CoA pyrophosphatase [Psychroflexus maritimus]
MDFSLFKNLVAKIRKNPLPGRDAHAIMTHESRRKELLALNFTDLEAKLASVMVLVYPNQQGKACIALIRRNKYPGVHSNQIGLPGGAYEKTDVNEEFTALRETEEEIGVPSEKIEVIQALTPLYIPPSNFLVSPFLGCCNELPNFIPQVTEVEEILEISLADLLAEECIQFKEVSSAYIKKTKVKCFYLLDEIVWGATAMVLSELKAILKSEN